MEATKRRPIRGVIWGIIFGVGLALIAIGQGWAALGTWPPFLLFLAGIVIGVAWSTVGPAKGGGLSASPSASVSPGPADGDGARVDAGASVGDPAGDTGEGSPDLV